MPPLMLDVAATLFIIFFSIVYLISRRATPFLDMLLMVNYAAAITLTPLFVCIIFFLMPPLDAIAYFLHFSVRKATLAITQTVMKVE